MNSSSPFFRKLLNIAKLIVILSILAFIVYKLEYSYHIQQLFTQLPILWNESSLLLIVSVFLLMPLNYFLEMLKWILVMRNHEKVTMLQAFKSISTGITLGIITPNKIGDIAGKSLFLEHYSKLKGAAASLSANIAQSVALLVAGAWAIALWLGIFYLPNLYYLLLIAAGISGITIILLFININQLSKLITHPKIAPYIEAFSAYSTLELWTLLLLSALRLIVFSTQYYLLLRFFSIDLPLQSAAMCIGLIYVSQTVLPSFILLEIGVRGAVALFFLGLYSTNNSGILGASYSLWMINAMIPGLVGLYFLATLKWHS